MIKLYNEMKNISSNSEKSTTVYSVVENYNTCSDVPFIKVVGTYETLDVAIEVATERYKQTKKVFVKDFTNDGFTVNDERCVLCSNDKLYRYEISICDNLFFESKN